MLISVIITTRNEEYNLPDLLDSLVVQEQPFEVIIIDSGSTDRTADIAKEYGKKYPFVKLINYAATRGESRNYGVKRARGDWVAFIDGDCIANPFWLKEFRRSLRHEKIVAGKTINLGYQPFVELDRVELFVTTAIIWTAQLLASLLWLRFFRHGPFEWLWRSITYGKAQRVEF